MIKLLKIAKIEMILRKNKVYRMLLGLIMIFISKIIVVYL